MNNEENSPANVLMSLTNIIITIVVLGALVMGGLYIFQAIEEKEDGEIKIESGLSL